MADYWLDLFSGKTWNEFRAHGAQVTGFRERRAGVAAQVKKGDIFLCYLTGVMRWVGAVRVLGPSKDKSAIWSESHFPVRLAVEPIVLLDPEEGVPMEQFEGMLDFYRGNEDRGKFKAFLRASPNRFKAKSDGEAILTALKRAEATPVRRPVDEKKLNIGQSAKKESGSSLH